MASTAMPVRRHEAVLDLLLDSVLSFVEIKSPDFIKLHLKDQKSSSNLYLCFRAQCEEYYKLQFPSGCGTWYGMSNGVVCLSRLALQPDSKIYLWNPIIQKTKTLPDSPLHFGKRSNPIINGKKQSDREAVFRFNMKNKNISEIKLLEECSSGKIYIQAYGESLPLFDFNCKSDMLELWILTKTGNEKVRKFADLKKLRPCKRIDIYEKLYVPPFSASVERLLLLGDASLGLLGDVDASDMPKKSRIEAKVIFKESCFACYS
ncbi:hypothetical protein AgCh_037584 [Apium graveolens]